MNDFDDSALFHAGMPYDPAKAREYYLRNRHLKGRKKGQQDPPAKEGQGAMKVSGGRSGTRTYLAKGRLGPPKGAHLSTEIKAKQEAMQKRLDRLKAVLSELVAAAKARSGVDPAEEAKKTAAANEKAKANNKPQTAKEKREAKVAYEKKKKLDSTIQGLQTQLTDVQAKIAEARAELKLANEKNRKSPSKTASKGR